MKWIKKVYTIAGQGTNMLDIVSNLLESARSVTLLLTRSNWHIVAAFFELKSNMLLQRRCDLSDNYWNLSFNQNEIEWCWKNRRGPKSHTGQRTIIKCRQSIPWYILRLESSQNQTLGRNHYTDRAKSICSHKYYVYNLLMSISIYEIDWYLTVWRLSVLYSNRDLLLYV